MKNNKKFILFLVFLLSFTLFGCGDSKESFNADYDSVLENANNLIQDSETVSSLAITVWDDVGPEIFVTYFSAFVSIENEADYKNQSKFVRKYLTKTIINDERLVVPDEDKENFYATLNKFKDAYTSLAPHKVALEEDYKELKDNYGNNESYSKKLELLKDYVSNASLYAEAAQAFEHDSISLIEYSKDLKKYSEELEKIKKDISLE